MKELRSVRQKVIKGFCAIVVAAGCLGISGNAKAVPLAIENTLIIGTGTLAVPSSNLFTNSLPETEFGVESGFKDTWSFSIESGGSDASMESFITSFDTFSSSQIVGLTADLFLESEPGSSLASFGTTDLGGFVLLSGSASPLAAGASFKLVIFGMATDASGGFYNGNINLSAVPLPGALLLFGTGLIGLAGFARRRVGANDMAHSVTT